MIITEIAIVTGLTAAVIALSILSIMLWVKLDDARSDMDMAQWIIGIMDQDAERVASERAWDHYLATGEEVHWTQM